jgi:hypothetical protein
MSQNILKSESRLRILADPGCSTKMFKAILEQENRYLRKALIELAYNLTVTGAIDTLDPKFAGPKYVKFFHRLSKLHPIVKKNLGTRKADRAAIAELCRAGLEKMTSFVE